MTFEKEREHAAELFSNCRNGKFSSANSTEWARSLEGFNQGARWARETTIAEVIALLAPMRLRSRFGWNEGCGEYTKDEYINEGVILGISHALIEISKLAQPTVVMKDEIYKLPPEDQL